MHLTDVNGSPLSVVHVAKSQMKWAPTGFGTALGSAKISARFPKYLHLKPNWWLPGESRFNLSLHSSRASRSAFLRHPLFRAVTVVSHQEPWLLLSYKIYFMPMHYCKANDFYVEWKTLQGWLTRGTAYREVPGWSVVLSGIETGRTQLTPSKN